MAESGPVLAVDVGGTKLAAAVVLPSGSVLGASVRPTPQGASSDVLFDALLSLVRSVIDSVGLPVVAAGVGCGGPMEWPAGIVSPVNIPGWRSFPLASRLSSSLGVPVRIHNDAVCAAVAEHWRGAGQGHASMLGMVVSTGVGGGLVLGGRVWDGASGNAGHVGHIVVDPSGPLCGCGGVGHLEAVARGPAVVAWALASGWTPGAASRSASRSASGPASGPGSGSGSGSASGPASGSGSGPASGSASGPASGSGSGPASGSASGPASGSGSGSGSGPASGSASGSASGAASGSASGAASGSAAGAASGSAAGGRRAGGAGAAVADGRLLAADARAGDPVALAAYERAGTMLGRGIASAVAAYDVTAVVIGGGFAASGDLLFDPLRRAYAEQAGLPFVRAATILPAALGSHTGLLGAAALVLAGDRYWTGG